jgi:hemolysin activation/secretion protein
LPVIKPRHDGFVRKFVGAVLLIFISTMVGAEAQVLQNVNPQSLPGSQVLPGTVSPIAPMLPPHAPSVAPGLPVPAPVTQPTSPGATRAISDVAVTGATVYPESVLAPLVAPLTGRAVPQSAIEAAREQLVRLYRGDGYVYTAVTAAIDGTHLRFIVNEGRIVDVKLEGNIGPAGTQVLRFLNHLVNAGPINVSVLERWLLLATDIPGITVRSVLNPSVDDPGALTLVAQVTRQPVSGLLTADNRSYKLTGPEEALAVVDFNSFTDLGERTEASIYRSFTGTQLFGQASTEFFVGGSGLKVRLYGGSGQATPSGQLASTGYIGLTTVFGAQISYPVVRRRTQSLNLLAIFDGLQSAVGTNNGSGGAKEQASYDSLRVLRAGADYSIFDVLLGPLFAATNSASLRVSQGLTILGASPNGDLNAPRVGEQVNFTKVSGEISRTQTLFHPWTDGTLAVLLDGAGQYSGDILPPEEKFFLGGPHFNRGFYYGEVTGDKALRATAELQLTTPIPMPGFVPFDTTAQFYGFYDWGETWENLSTDPDERLVSAGFGSRFYVTQYTEFDLEGAFRVTRQPSGSGSGNKPLGAGVLYWQVLARF